MKDNFVIEAVHTIRAKWWELWCARLFGKKTTEVDDRCDYVCTIHEWRGKRYMTNAVPGMEWSQPS